MNSLWSQFSASLPRLTVMAALDIVLVAVLIYQLAMILRGRRAAHVLAGIGFVLLAYAGSIWLGLELLRGILEKMVPFAAFAMIVLFQSEVRRFLARIGRRRWLTFGSRLENQEAMRDIQLAVQQLAHTRTGALIAIEKDIGLRTFVESGVPMDAALTLQLLIAIFQKGSPLHDGAVIVQGTRVAAAACFLPITTDPELSRRLGTRHRAGIGITEESDCLAIIVSEETGRISLASSGNVRLDVTAAELSAALGLTEGEPTVAGAAPREAGRWG